MFHGNKWDCRFLEIAKMVSTWSKDPSSKIGAVAVGQDRRILSTGYNGFPKGIEDIEERLNDKEIKYALVVHAEMNCIYNASLTGVSLKDASLYVYGLPTCSECAKGVIQSGITSVIMTSMTENTPEKWVKSYEKTKALFIEAGVATKFL